MRTFEGTHPWLSFSVDLRRAQPGFWILLGEARSKCDHVAGTPLRPAIAEALHRLFLAKGALATTAIEGNTLSEDEAQRLIEGKLRVPPSREYLKTEVENVVDVCNDIMRRIGSGESGAIQPATIKELNARILDNLELEDGIVPGEIRKHVVGVAGYRGAPAEDCEFLLTRLCDWLEGPELRAPAGMEMIYAIIKAILAHLYVAWIHPFGDGNGRTARMVEFQILVAAGVPGASAHLLSTHYNLTRPEYYRQLDRSSRTGGDVLPFLSYAIQGFVDGLRGQLALIREQQWDIAWRNYVDEAFRDLNKERDRRRRRLVLDLSLQSDPIPMSRLSGISPAVARDYARRTPKTLARDVKELERMRLVRRTESGWEAHRASLLAFLPARAPAGAKEE